MKVPAHVFDGQCWMARRGSEDVWSAAIAFIVPSAAYEGLFHVAVLDMAMGFKDGTILPIRPQVAGIVLEKFSFKGPDSDWEVTDMFAPSDPNPMMDDFDLKPSEVPAQ